MADIIDNSSGAMNYNAPFTSTEIADKYKLNDYSSFTGWWNRVFGPNRMDMYDKMLDQEYNTWQAQLDRDFNASEAQKARDFQEYMTKNQYQMITQSMKDAGLNPVLALQNGNFGGISSSGAQANAGGRSVGSYGSRRHSQEFGAVAMGLVSMILNLAGGFLGGYQSAYKSSNIGFGR